MGQSNTVIKLLTFILTIHLGFLISANNVEIPDESFKTFIIANGFDVNADGEIDESEAEAIDSLRDVNFYTFSDITGISEFTNLKYANFSGARIRKGMDFSNNQELTYLNLDENWFTSLAIHNNPKLEYLSINDTYSYYLDISGCENLRFFSANNCIYTEYLIMPALTKLQYLHYAKMPGYLAQRFYKCPNLEYIDLTGAYASEFDLSHFKKLKYINLSGSLVQYIDISNCLDIEEVYCKGSVLGLDSLHKYQELRVLLYTNYVYSKENYGYTSLDFSRNPNLQHLKLSREFITELDLSNNPNLQSLDISFCRRLEYLNLKNGSSLGFTEAPQEVSRVLNMRRCSKLEIVCADDEELDIIKQAIGSRSQNVDFSHAKCTTPPSSIDYFQTSNPQGTRLRIFPNPVDYELNLRLSESINRIELYSINGVKIKDLPVNNVVQVTDLLSGVYILRITSDEGKSYTQRFVKK